MTEPLHEEQRCRKEKYRPPGVEDEAERDSNGGQADVHRIASEAIRPGYDERRSRSDRKDAGARAPENADAAEHQPEAGEGRARRRCSLPAPAARPARGHQRLRTRPPATAAAYRKGGGKRTPGLSRAPLISSDYGPPAAQTRDAISRCVELLFDEGGRTSLAMASATMRSASDCSRNLSVTARAAARLTTQT